MEIRRKFNDVYFDFVAFLFSFLTDTFLSVPSMGDSSFFISAKFILASVSVSLIANESYYVYVKGDALKDKNV